MNQANLDFATNLLSLFGLVLGGSFVIWLLVAIWLVRNAAAYDRFVESNKRRTRDEHEDF